MGIAKFFESGKSRIALKIVEDMAKAYLKFVIRWGAIEANQYPEFFSLRDFYSLIKTFMKSLKEREAESSQTVLSAASRAIFRNFSGQIGSASMFRKIFF